ncbi:MAG: hypothetical protein HFG23_06120 [Anaerotruncus sp.]|nr:hypothetical protein [Anaerotruncus sp.]
MLKTIQEKIDQTEYWDMPVLDFQIKFFGDEVDLFLYHDEDTSWKLSFLTCHRVAYETDATWRGVARVREMKKPQLGYYGQDITLNKSKEFDGFYDVSMDLTILTAQIVCKEITVEKVSNDSWDIFWKKNENGK